LQCCKQYIIYYYIKIIIGPCWHQRCVQTAQSTAVDYFGGRPWTMSPPPPSSWFRGRTIEILDRKFCALRIASPPPPPPRTLHMLLHRQLYVYNRFPLPSFRPVSPPRSLCIHYTAINVIIVFYLYVPRSFQCFYITYTRYSLVGAVSCATQKGKRFLLKKKKSCLFSWRVTF